ncbi:MAG: prolipoprotein diacylglyceryl transferase [Acidobacteriota bacterium]
MIPVLFTIGGIPIYSFGLMMGISFIIGSTLLTGELRRKKMNPDMGSTITLLALAGGIAGSKILYLIENWGDFIDNPVSMAFSPGGLTFYGGFILATILIGVYLKRQKVSFWRVADAVAPALLLAYGIARIGCHLAGDGDYGFPTDLPWGTDYSKGTYPPSAAFKDFPEITSKYPHGVVPDTVPCHPTPVYEFLICSVMFYFLWKSRKRLGPDGTVFAAYLMLAGVERFAVEFLRLNERFVLGLSEAQIISVFLIFIGAWLFRQRRSAIRVKP